MFKEKVVNAPNGIGFIFVLLVLQASTLAVMIYGFSSTSGWLATFGGIAVLASFICWFGFFMVNPKEGRVLQLFGQYVGTVHAPGLRWANPFYSKMRVSLRVRNFESSKLKVNDKNGNPIEIAAVIVWEVTDTAGF